MGKAIRLMAAVVGLAAGHCMLGAAMAPAYGQDAKKRAAVDVVFVLDTTGSMSGLLEGAKQKI